MDGRGPSARAPSRAHAALAARAGPARVRAGADRRCHARRRARLPGPVRGLGQRGQLGLAGVQPLAPGPLRRDGRRRPARARCGRRHGAHHRRARARARGGRLAGGRPRAGGRLAVVPGDDGPGRARLGRRGPRLARARRGQAAPQRRAHQPRPAAGAQDRRSAAHARAVAPARRQLARGCRAAGGHDPHGPDAPPGARPLPAHAAVARPPGLRGRLLPDAAGHPRGRRPALGAAQRRLPGLHERAGDGHRAQRRAHRRPRPHHDRRPLARRVGAAPTSATSVRCAATPPRSRRCGGAASSTTCPGTAA